MALSDHERDILDEIERNLHRDHPARAGRLAPAVHNLIGLALGVLAVVIGVTLMRSEAAGLTLLIGCGLLGAIGYLHRYDLRHQ